MLLYCSSVLSIRTEQDQRKIKTCRKQRKTRDQSASTKQGMETQMSEHLQAAFAYSILTEHVIVSTTCYKRPAMLHLPIHQRLRLSYPNPFKIKPVSSSTDLQGRKLKGMHSTHTH